MSFHRFAVIYRPVHSNFPSATFQGLLQGVMTKTAKMQGLCLLQILLLIVACSCLASDVPDPQVRRIVSMPYKGWLGFKFAKAGQLVTIVVREDTTRDSIPIARSYDGRPFEVAPGPYAYGELPLDCSTETQMCEIDITVIERKGSLHEITYSSYLDPSSQKGVTAMVARFLEQAT